MDYGSAKRTFSHHHRQQAPLALGNLEGYGSLLHRIIQSVGLNLHALVIEESDVAVEGGSFGAE